MLLKYEAQINNKISIHKKCQMAICRRVANQLKGHLSAKGSENVDMVLDKFCTNILFGFVRDGWVLHLLRS